MAEGQGMVEVDWGCSTLSDALNGNAASDGTRYKAIERRLVTASGRENEFDVRWLGFAGVRIIDQSEPAGNMANGN